MLGLPTTVSAPDEPERALAEPEFILPSAVLGSIANWCAAPCVHDDRVWAGLNALYRDSSEWHDSGRSCTRSEFVEELTVLGIEVDLQFAHGFALRQDVDALQESCSPVCPTLEGLSTCDEAVPYWAKLAVESAGVG